MDKKLFRSLLLLITFTVALVFLVVRFDDLWGAVRLVLSQLTPLFAGLAIAFILSRPCAFFRRTLDKGLGKTPLAGLSLPLAVALSYLLLIGVVAAIFAFVIPQLTSSVGRFAANLSGYLSQAQVWLNELMAWLHLEQLDLSQFGQNLKEFTASSPPSLPPYHRSSPSPAGWCLSSSPWCWPWSFLSTCSLVRIPCWASADGS